MKEKLYRFMQGRYGVDELSKFLNGAALVFLLFNILVNIFLPGTLLGTAMWLIAIFCMIWSYFRIFSKNRAARYGELAKFNRAKGKFEGWLKRLKQRKDYKFFRCPGCKQLIRVPRGKGKVRITCPKCKTVFEQKS